jgi:hypothetical protein
MHDKLLETCENEFERGVKSLFENALWIPGTGTKEIPVIGGRFLPYGKVPPGLCERVYRALCSREQFHRDKPAWAPALPLHEKTIAAMERADSIWLRLVGLYACSLRKTEWHYEIHPDFHSYCSGLMSYRATPDRIRNDRELQREFPPRELVGLCDGALYWRSFEQIARDRGNLARTAVMEAREASIGAG